MMKMRGFLVGLGGGAVGAALVVLVLVLVFDFGEVKQTVVQRTAQTPAVCLTSPKLNTSTRTRTTRAAPTAPPPSPARNPLILIIAFPSLSHLVSDEAARLRPSAPLPLFAMMPVGC